MGVSGSGTHDEAVQEMGCQCMGVAFMMRLEVLPVTVPDGDNSSPSVPDGTGGPKSKSNRPTYLLIFSVTVYV